MSSEIQTNASDRSALVHSPYVSERIQQPSQSSSPYHGYRSQEHPESATSRDYAGSTCTNYGATRYEYPATSSAMTISHYDEEYQRGNGSDTPSVSEASSSHVYPGASTPVSAGGALPAPQQPSEHGALPNSAQHHPEGVENIAPAGHYHPAHHSAAPGLDQIPPEHRVHWLPHEHPENMQPYHFQQHFHEHFPFQGPFPGGFPPQIVIGPNGKPKRRRVATIAQRRAANIRERRRMFNLNEAFDELRKKVPTFAYEKRLSRIETLRLAITYISFMADLVEGKDPKDIKLASVSKASVWGPTSTGRQGDSEEDATHASKLSDTESQAPGSIDGE